MGLGIGKGESGGVEPGGLEGGCGDSGEGGALEEGGFVVGRDDGVRLVLGVEEGGEDCGVGIWGCEI